ncbi:MAG: COG3650 family protein [Vibrio sp.]
MRVLPLGAILCAILLQACSTNRLSTQQSESTPTIIATLDKPETIQPASFMLRGEVVIGHELQRFTPCGSQQQYWLNLSAEQLRDALALNLSPYQPLYGEIVGTLLPPSQTGYNGDYVARIAVQSINQLSREQRGCEQPIRPTRAFGNEPFWSLRFVDDGLQFQPRGGAKQHLSITRTQLSATQRRYQFEGGELELEPAKCQNGTEQTLYQWRSKLSLQGGHYQGCASLANLDPTLEWSGVYFARSTAQTGFSVSLSLEPDHTAQTRYEYADGQPPIIEQGYWQQLNPNQIQVVMTRHQQQYLLSERIFTRDGDQLTTQQEKVGPLIYPITNGGLVLFRSLVELSDSIAPPAVGQAALFAQQISGRADYRADVDQAIRRYFALHQTATDDTQYRWLEYDLNGDEQPELLVQLDWCGTGGCTLLIFEQHQQQWRFNSRMTLVQNPIRLGQQTHHGWRDLMLSVSGGGAKPAVHRLQYNGISYPLNPSVAPEAEAEQISQVLLFADGLSPRQAGLKL